MNLKLLAEPFPASDIEWRIGQCGKGHKGIWAKCLAYITARAVMDRLDAVCGPEGWRVSYVFVGTGVVCQLSIKVGNEWVTKEDGAEQTDIESFKGGISSALKRAGAVWGLGRYLYSLEEGFATVIKDRTDDAHWGKTKEGDQFYWLPPQLPAWALPKVSKPVAPAVAITPPVKAVTPVVMAKRPASMDALKSEIMDKASAIGLTKQGVVEWMADLYKKPATQLTQGELENFIEVLDKEIALKGASK